MRAFLLVFLLVFVTGAAHALDPAPSPPPKPYNGRMMGATQGLVEVKMGKLGFTTSDPRYQATKMGISGTVSTVAGTVAAGLGVTALALVGWPAIIVGAVIGGAVGAVTYYLTDSGITWAVNEFGEVVQVTPGGVPDAALPPGWCYTWGSTSICAGTKSGVASALTAESAGQSVSQFRYNPNTGNMEGYWPAGDQWVSWGVCCSMIEGQPAVVEPSTITGRPDTVAAQLTPEQMAEPLAASAMAEMANALWRKAAAADPQVLPWSPANPITVAEAQAWREANPEAWPTVGDFAAAVAPEGATSVPQPETTPGVGTTPGTGTQVDLGPDPNVGAPGLEPIPTAQDIMAPGFSLMPDLRAFVMPQVEGQCPQPEFSVFDRAYSMTAHCDLFEQNRYVLQLAMVALYSLLAVVIVLRA